MAEEEEEVVKLILRDRDPLRVSKQKLVKNSSVFSYILVECSQSEHDMTDFTPEIVEKFLALLEDNDAEQIEVSNFRELHKISVVFNVESLIGFCRGWLVEKINKTDDVVNYWSMSFFFEECYFVYNKWHLATLIRALILEARFKNNSLFLSRCVEEKYDQLSTDQLRFVLFLAGSKTKVFLEILGERLGRQECLDNRTRYLLQHMNLSLCVQQHEHLYHEMSRNLSNMSDNSPENLRLVLRLTTEATKEAFDRKNDASNKTPESDFIEEWLPLYDDCKCLADIVRFATEGKISSMDVVVEILARVAHHNTINTEEAEEFVETLGNLSQSKNLWRVSASYIDLWITALEEFSDNDRETQLMNLLKSIGNSDKLSSFYDNINLVGEEIKQATVKSVKKVLRKTNSSTKYLFKHQKITDCEREGECGFIIKRYEDKNHIVKFKLSREESDYTNSGVHIHEGVRTDNMHWYRGKAGRTDEGKIVKVLVRWGWGWWTDWFEGVVANWEDVEHCVNYKIRDFIVARC